MGGVVTSQSELPRRTEERGSLAGWRRRWRGNRWRGSVRRWRHGVRREVLAGAETSRGGRGRGRPYIFRAGSRVGLKAGTPHETFTSGSYPDLRRNFPVHVRGPLAVEVVATRRGGGSRWRQVSRRWRHERRLRLASLGVFCDVTVLNGHFVDELLEDDVFILELLHPFAFLLNFLLVTFLQLLIGSQKKKYKV